MLSPTRYGLAALALWLALPATVPAQESQPTATLLGGVGNVIGGFGAGAEYYVAGSSVSLAAGVGYWPSEDLCDQGTVSGAGALRVFLGGPRHRGFLEGSYSLLEISCFAGGGQINRHYGPGLSAGYRYTSSGGFTFTAGGGIGDASNGSVLLILLGLGYTWQR